jgi:hypothetical protein
VCPNAASVQTVSPWGSSAEKQTAVAIVDHGHVAGVGVESFGVEANLTDLADGRDLAEGRADQHKEGEHASSHRGGNLNEGCNERRGNASAPQVIMGTLRLEVGIR